MQNSNRAYNEISIETEIVIFYLIFISYYFS